jgi:hypothetical protein
MCRHHCIGRIANCQSALAHNGVMQDRVRPLAADLERIFGPRLQSLIVYGDGSAEDDGVHTLALVERLTFQDLAACAPLVPGWRTAGLAVPLLLGRDEFIRTLDVFPIEWGDILTRHVVVAGADPFQGVRVHEADLRRACELQAKSHLIHLREGFLEAAGQPLRVAQLIAASAPALRTLVARIEQLAPHCAGRAGLTPELLAEVSAAEASTIADPSALLARYLDAVERLWQEVDRWRL